MSYISGAGCGHCQLDMGQVVFHACTVSCHQQPSDSSCPVFLLTSAAAVPGCLSSLRPGSVIHCLFVCLCPCVMCGATGGCEGGGQRTIFRSGFSPFTIEVLGIELKSSCLVACALILCQPPLGLFGQRVNGLRLGGVRFP